MRGQPPQKRLLSPGERSGAQLPRLALLALLAVTAGHATAADIPIPFQLQKAGNVSAAIYDGQGRMVRELARAMPHAAGAARLQWDGLDREGRAVPPGQYRWKVLATPGLKSEYLMSVGTSVAEQPWPGNHAGPRCLAMAPNSFLVAASTEGPPEIARVGLDGKVLWERASFEPARGPAGIAVQNNRVYYLQNSGKIQVLDLESGASLGKPLNNLFPVKTLSFAGLDGTSAQPQTFSFEVPNGEYFLRFHYGGLEAATTLVEVSPNGMGPSAPHRVDPGKLAWWQMPPAVGGRSASIFLPQLYQNPAVVPVRDGRLTLKLMPQVQAGQKPNWNLTHVEVLALPDKIAATDTELVLCSAGAGAIMWLDPKNGAVLDTAAVSGVKDLAVGQDGQVYVLQGHGVARLTRSARTPLPVISGLQDTVALALDRARGELLVVEGQGGTQVKRFAPNGRLLATYGRAGGRRNGNYVAEDFAGITGIVAREEGGFLVAEGQGAPRRVAHLDARGQVVQQWFGGMGFYTHTSLDPDNSAEGWMRPQEKNWMLRVEMDYARQSWRPTAAYNWEELLDPAYFGRIPEYTAFRCLKKDLNGDGHKETLLWSQGTSGLLLVEDEQMRCLRPLAAMGLMDAELFDGKNPVPLEQLPAAWAGAIRLAGGDPANAASRVKYARYAWADADGNGQMEAAELQLAPGPLGFASAVRVGPDLTLWQGRYHTDQYGLYQRYSPVRYTAVGAPVWDLTRPYEAPKTERKAQVAGLDSNAAGELFMLLLDGGDGGVSQGTYDMSMHGWSWPATLFNGSALVRLDATDKLLWQSGPKAARWPHPRGQLMAPRNINGFARGCIAIGDQVANPCEFWTEDGLYVGGLFDGRDGWDGSLPGGPPDRLYTWHGTRKKRIGANDFREHSLFAADDMLMGGSVAELQDGSVVFLGHGANNNPTYRITGWDGWERASGTVSVPPGAKTPAAAGSGPGLSGTFWEAPDFQGEAHEVAAGAIWFGGQKPWPRAVPAANFSARWSGFIEPKFSEEYTLSLYYRGEVKLRVNGREVEWARQDYPRDRNDKKLHSVPLPLRAGQKVAVQLEFQATAAQPYLHLNWESLSQPVEHIPASALYRD